MSKRILSTVLSLIFLCVISPGGQTRGKNFIRSDRTRALKSSAMKVMKQIVSAQETYRTTGGRSGYGTIQDLDSTGLVNFVDSRYAVKNGYLFISLRAETSHFMVIAFPIDFLENGDSKHKALLATNEGIVSVSARDWRKDVDGVAFAEDEAMIVGIVRTVATAQEWYRSSAGGGQSFGTLEQLLKEGAIDDSLGAGARNGYRFTVILTNNRSQFEVFATPLEYGATGLRSYYCSNEYIIHSADKKGARALASDPALP